MKLLWVSAMLMWIGGIANAQDDATITMFDGRSLIIVGDDLPAGMPTREGVTTHADAYPGIGVVMFAGGTGDWLLVQMVLLYEGYRSHVNTLQISAVPDAFLMMTAIVPTDMDGGVRQFATSAGGTAKSFTGLTSSVDGVDVPVSIGRGFFGNRAFSWDAVSSGQTAEGARIVSEVLVGHMRPSRSGASLAVSEAE